MVAVEYPIPGGHHDNNFGARWAILCFIFYYPCLALKSFRRLDSVGPAAPSLFVFLTHDHLQQSAELRPPCAIARVGRVTRASANLHIGEECSGRVAAPRPDERTQFLGGEAGVPEQERVDGGRRL